MITRNCDWCNTEYTARSTRGKTCSRKCSDDLYNSSKRDNSKRKYYIKLAHRVCNSRKSNKIL